MNLGSLAVGATDSIQISGLITTNLFGSTNIDVAYVWFTNVFQVFADQTDPIPTNNTAAVVSQWMDGTTIYTSSTWTIETNLTANVSQQATNFSTELIARLPNGTVVYDQTFNAAYSDPTVQAAVTLAAGDLSGAGATSYTGPTQTSFLQNLESSSSVAVTNIIGTDTSFATSLYIGPQTIMVSANQSEPYFVAAGQQVFDTLVTTVVTNLVTTTNTSIYTNSAVYMMTGIVAQADLSLSASAAPEPVIVGSNLVYTIAITNRGTAAATGVVVSNPIPASVNFVSATGGSTPSGGILLVNLGSLAAGAANSAQIVVGPTMAGKLTNLFQVFANQTDPVTTNNFATVVSTVTNGPALPVDVALSLTAAPNPVDVGAPLTYSLTVTNNSLTPATGVVVSNSLPPNVSVISVLPSQGAATNQSGVVTYTVGSLPNRLLKKFHWNLNMMG